VGPGRQGLYLGRLVGDVDETSLEYLYSSSTNAFSCAAWVCMSLQANLSAYQEQDRLILSASRGPCARTGPSFLTGLALALRYAAVRCMSYLVPRRARRCGYVLRR
jgi:hypothetical protein